MTDLGLSPKQVESVAWADQRVNVWHGAVRSGKTISSLLAWAAFVATAPRGGNLLVVGRTRDSVARNVFQPLQDPTLFGELARHVSYTAGAPTAKILGRRIDVIGASNVLSENVVRGLTVAGVYVDEATLIAEAMWKQLLARMSVPGARLFATTNPDGPSHWFRKEVLLRAGALGYRVFKFRLEDNAWLMRNNPEYVAQLKREYAGLWYRRFILGDWVQAEGAIYSMWDPDRHVLPHAAIPVPWAVLSLGMDYGTTNPTRGELITVGPHPHGPDKGAALYVADEWAPPKLTDAGLSANLTAWLADDRRPGRPQWLHIDPAAASLRLQLFGDGYSNAAPASNQVNAGITLVSSLLEVGRLYVSDRCTHLIDQLPGYVWDPKATERGLDAPVKADDHEADALRYGVYSTRALWRNLVPVAPAGDTAPGVDGAAADLEGADRAAA